MLDACYPSIVDRCATMFNVAATYGHVDIDFASERAMLAHRSREVASECASMRWACAIIVRTWVCTGDEWPWVAHS